MTRINPDSRFQPLGQPYAAPGCCFLCRGTNGPYVDTQVSIQFEGAVIICQGCVKEMHAQLGLESVINQEEFDYARSVAQAEGVAEGRQTLLEALNVFVADYSPGDSGVPEPDLSVPPAVEDGDRIPESTGSTGGSLFGPDRTGEALDLTSGSGGRPLVPANPTDGQSITGSAGTLINL